MAYIKLENITYQYPTATKPIFENLSLELEKGKIYGLIGRNGCGKSTFAKILIGFMPHFYKGIFEGTVEIAGVNVSEVGTNALVSRIGYIFQNPFNQISGIKKTVYEEIAFGLENLSLEVDEIKKRTNNVIKLLNLERIQNNSPFEISGGQQQKVAFASAYVMHPDIFILDEPVSQLDPDSAQEIYEVVRKLKAEGKTIIIIEQNIDLLESVVDEYLLVINTKQIKKRNQQELFKDDLVFDIGIRHSRNMFAKRIRVKEAKHDD